MDTFQSLKEFLQYIENNYEEEEQIIIENFMSYYINEYRGFGNKNCKYTYEEDLLQDESGELHKLGLIGFEFEKKKHDERLLKKSKKHDISKP